MASIREDPIAVRNRALSFLERGEELYTNPKNSDDQTKGFKIYKKGVGFMIDYARGKFRHCINLIIILLAERNPVLASKVTAKLKEWVNRAKLMGVKVASARSKSSVILPKGPVDNNVQPKSPLSARESKIIRKKMVEHNSFGDDLKSRLKNTLIHEKPDVKWQDIAGLEQAKAALLEAVLYPIKYPHLFVGFRTPWKGILLYGVELY